MGYNGGVGDDDYGWSVDGQHALRDLVWFILVDDVDDDDDDAAAADDDDDDDVDDVVVDDDDNNDADAVLQDVVLYLFLGIVIVVHDITCMVYFFRATSQDRKHWFTMAYLANPPDWQMT